MPPGINVLTSFGIGPIELVGLDGLPHAPPFVLWILSALGSFSFALSAIAAASQWRVGLEQRGPALFWLAFGAVHLGMYLVRAPFFDRYLLPVLPVWVATSLLCTARLRPTTALSRAASAGVLAALAVVGLAGTHDFLARNRAAWQIAEREIAAGALPETLDAGFPYKVARDESPGSAVGPPGALAAGRVLILHLQSDERLL